MNGLLRPSEAATLAIHACGALAAAPNRPLTTSEIASAIGASAAHLSKVLQRLSHAGIVQGRRGPSGGFTLADDPASLSLRRVYEAIDGPLPGSGCLLGVPICRGAACPLASLLARVGSEIAEGLSGVTLNDLGLSVARGKARRAAPGAARKRSRSSRTNRRATRR